jgi:PAS domain S-box-containing protein
MAAQSRTFIWEVDLEGKYTFISPFCEMIIGYSPDELVGKGVFN